MTRKCIVRDLDSALTTAPMSCFKAMEIAESGDLYRNWAIDEVVHNPNGSVPILQACIQFKDNKYIYYDSELFSRLI